MTPTNFPKPIPMKAVQMTDNETLVPTYPGGPLVTPAERAAIRASAEQHVQAALDLERCTRETFSANPFGCSAPRDGCGYLFDPNTMPHMRQLADSVMHHLHTSHELEYIDRSDPRAATYKRYDPHDPNLQGCMFVHFVGQPNRLYAFHDRAEAFRWLWQCAWPTDRCNIGAHPACDGVQAGYCMFLPCQRGQFLIMFEACMLCVEHLNDQALGGVILAEADAQLAAEANAPATIARWRAIRAEQE